jgi:ADP-ribose pyrophosphatase YjhB (NUDIX family)
MAKHYYSEEEFNDWLAKLPKKLVTSKAIIKSTKGNILLVMPNYEDVWHFPGGGLESGKEPVDGLARELKEELGITIDRSKLKLLGTVFYKKYDNLILNYEYLELLDEDADISYQESELEGYKYEKPESVGPQMSTFYAKFWASYISQRN